MLGSLTKADWLSALDISEGVVPDVLVLRGTRHMRALYEEHRSFFSAVLDLGGSESFFEDVLIGTLNGHRVGYASVYGAAMAAEVTHVFGCLGTRLVLQTGSCGAIDERLSVGDLFVPTSAYCGDGASQHYTDCSRVAASALAGRYKSERQSLPGHRYGQIFTTSALLSQDASHLEKWRASGCHAVDMETAATFAAAERFGMERAALLFVSDHITEGTNVRFQDERMADSLSCSASRLVFDEAVDYCRVFSGG